MQKKAFISQRLDEAETWVSVSDLYLVHTITVFFKILLVAYDKWMFKREYLQKLTPPQPWAQIVSTLKKR